MHDSSRGARLKRALGNKQEIESSVLVPLAGAPQRRFAHHRMPLRHVVLTWALAAHGRAAPPHDSALTTAKYPVKSQIQCFYFIFLYKYMYI